MGSQSTTTTTTTSTSSSEPLKKNFECGATSTYYRWDDTACWKCWEMLPPIQREMKLSNRKYCWLYPKAIEKKQLKELEPNFKECAKNIYTRCDYQLEACVYEQILKVEDHFKHLSRLVEIEMIKQNMLIKRLWQLATRMLILRNSGVFYKPYPDIVSVPEERRISCEFSSLMKMINLSNCRIGNALVNAHSVMKKMNRCISRLDTTLESTLIVGGETIRERPLAYIQELIADLHQYFHGLMCKLKIWAQLISVNDIEAVENYEALIHPSKDYENNLQIGIPDCTCLRSRKMDCIKRNAAPCALREIF